MHRNAKTNQIINKKEIMFKSYAIIDIMSINILLQTAYERVDLHNF